MKKSIIAAALSAIAFAAAVPASATTFTPDANSVTNTYAGSAVFDIDTYKPTTMTINVADQGIIQNLSTLLVTNVDYADDLTVTLSHLGTTVTLFKGVGDTLSSVINATFDDDALKAVGNHGSVFGSVRPYESLSAFSGLQTAGAYTFSFTDKIEPGDHTALVQSALNICSSAVPESATWMTMILGFGAIGFALRRNQTQKAVAL